MTRNTDKNNRSFAGQRDDEEVVEVFRRHIIAMRKGFYSLLICMVLGAFPFLIWQDNLDLLWVFVGGFGLGLLLFSYNFVIWYFSVFILTNQRLRQITQKGLFGSSVIELKLGKIHNISYDVPGLSGELFRFGTLIIQTYAGDLVIKNVENPEKIYNILQDTIDNYEKENGNATTKDQKEER